MSYGEMGALERRTDADLADFLRGIPPGIRGGVL
jgi:hypothetical protein